MMYLKEFNLTDTDLDEIYNNLSNEDWVYITSRKYRIIDLLNVLKELGFNNFKDLLMYKTNILYQDIDELENKIKSSNLIAKLNEDINNFNLLNKVS